METMNASSRTPAHSWQWPSLTSRPCTPDFESPDTKLEQRRAVKHDVEVYHQRQRSMSSRQVEEVAAATRFRLHLDQVGPDYGSDTLVPSRLTWKTEPAMRLREGNGPGAMTRLDDSRSPTKDGLPSLPKLKTGRRPTALDLSLIHGDLMTPQTQSAGLPTRSSSRGAPHFASDRHSSETPSAQRPMVMDLKPLHRTPIKDITPESAKSFNFDFTPDLITSPASTRPISMLRSPTTPSRSPRNKQRWTPQQAPHLSIEFCVSEDYGFDNELGVFAPLQTREKSDMDSLLELYLDRDDQTKQGQVGVSDFRQQSERPNGLSMHPYQYGLK